MRFVAFALPLLIASSAHAEIDITGSSSFWLAKLSASATDGAPVIGTEGVYALPTFCFAGDYWLTESFAVGGSATIAYGTGDAPMLLAYEGRAKLRQELGGPLSFLGVASLGVPQVVGGGHGMRYTLPSVGVDGGLALPVGEQQEGGRLRSILAFLTVGVFHARFAADDVGYVDGNVVTAKQHLSVTALRFTVGTALGF